MSQIKYKLLVVLILIILSSCIIALINDKYVNILCGGISVICVSYIIASVCVKYENPIYRFSSISQLLLSVIIVVSSFFVSDSIYYKCFMIIYFVNFAAMFALTYLRNIVNGEDKETMTLKSLKKDYMIWLLCSMVIWGCAFNLFESSIGYFQYGFRRRFIMPIIFIGFWVYYFWTGKTILKLGYVLALISFGICGLFYFGLFSSQYSEYLYIAQIASAVLCIVILLRDCIVDFMQIRNAINIILMMFLIKGLLICKDISEIDNVLIVFRLQ